MNIVKFRKVALKILVAAGFLGGFAGARLFDGACAVSACELKLDADETVNDYFKDFEGIKTLSIVDDLDDIKRYKSDDIDFESMFENVNANANMDILLSGLFNKLNSAIGEVKKDGGDLVKGLYKSLRNYVYGMVEDLENIAKVFGNYNKKYEDHCSHNGFRGAHLWGFIKRVYNNFDSNHYYFNVLNSDDCYFAKLREFKKSLEEFKNEFYAPILQDIGDGKVNKNFGNVEPQVEQPVNSNMKNAKDSKQPVAIPERIDNYSNMIDKDKEEFIRDLFRSSEVAQIVYDFRHIDEAFEKVMKFFKGWLKDYKENVNNEKTEKIVDDLASGMYD